MEHHKARVVARLTRRLRDALLGELIEKVACAKVGFGKSVFYHIKPTNVSKLRIAHMLFSEAILL